MRQEIDKVREQLQKEAEVTEQKAQDLIDRPPPPGLRRLRPKPVGGAGVSPSTCNALSSDDEGIDVSGKTPIGRMSSVSGQFPQAPGQFHRFSARPGGHGHLRRLEQQGLVRGPHNNGMPLRESLEEYVQRLHREAISPQIRAANRRTFM